MGRILRVFFIVAALLAAVPAHARVAGTYYTFGGGYALAEENDGIIDRDASDGTEADVNYKPGYAFTVASGVAYQSGFRTELELGFLPLKLKELEERDRIPGAGIAKSDLDGPVNVYTATANLFFDLKLRLPVAPYFGGGIGLAYMQSDSFHVGTEKVDRSGLDWTAFGEVGVAIPASTPVRIMPSYRYQKIFNGDDEFEDDQLHIFRIGLQIVF